MAKTLFVKGPKFDRIGPESDYQRLGQENWEKLNNGDAIEIDPQKELIEKDIVVKHKQKTKEVK